MGRKAIGWALVFGVRRFIAAFCMAMWNGTSPKSGDQSPHSKDRSGIDLASRGMTPEQAADLRNRLAAFAEDWERPEMDAYDAL